MLAGAHSASVPGRQASQMTGHICPLCENVWMHMLMNGWYQR